MKTHTPALDSIRCKRIAHMIESDGPGGAERMVAALAGAFERAGCPSVAVLPVQGEGWLAKQLEGTNVVIDHVALGGPASPRVVLALARLFRRHRIDVVHSHEFTMGVFGSAAARLAGIPHFITMHGGRHYASAWHRRLAMRAGIGLSAGLVGVSESVAAQLRQDLNLSGGRVTVIPNGVPRPPKVSGTLRAELGLAPTDRLVVAVGNLYPVKGHDVLVNALAQVAKTIPGVHVAIAGRGEMREPLQRQAEELGVAPSLHLLGYRADIANILVSGDVFALPSRSEGLPLAVLEAMFTGLPIVATDVGDVASVLAEGAGLVVPPEDATSLAGALRVVLSDRAVAERLGAAALRRAGAEYDLSQSVERYAALFARRLGVDQPA